MVDIACVFDAWITNSLNMFTSSLSEVYVVAMCFVVQSVSIIVGESDRSPSQMHHSSGGGT